MSVITKKTNQDIQVRKDSMTNQICKGIALTTSSIGLGWALSKLWGSDSLEQSRGESPTSIQWQSPIVQGGISKVHSQDTAAAIFQQLILPPPNTKVVSQQEKFHTNPLYCGLGLALGGSASVITYHPLPLAIGASLCTPPRALACSHDIKWDYEEVRNYIKEINAVAKKAGEDLNLVAQKVEKMGDKFRLTFKEGFVEVWKMGDSLKASVDETLSKALKGADLRIEAFGSVLEFNIGQAEKAVNAALLKLPFVASETAEQAARGLVHGFKQSILGHSHVRNLGHQIQLHKQAELINLIECVRKQSVGPLLSVAEKVELYRILLTLANNPQDMPNWERRAIVIAYTAIHDPDIQQGSANLWFWQTNYTESVLEGVANEEIKNILRHQLVSEMHKRLPIMRFEAIATAQNPPQDTNHLVENIPVGGVVAFASEVIPPGYLACDGNKHRRSDYPKLFKVIAHRHGHTTDAEGVEWFTVPDYRGHFLRGWDNGAGQDPDVAERVNLKDEVVGDVVGSRQKDAIKLPADLTVSKHDGHKHTTDVQGLHNHNINEKGHKTCMMERSPGGDNTLKNGDTSPGEPHLYHCHWMRDAGAHGHEISTDGSHTHVISGGGKETRPKNVNVMYIIKAEPTKAFPNLEIDQLRKEMDSIKWQQTAFLTTTVAAVIINVLIRR